MNSKKLIELYKEVYSSFYAHHSTVMSLPLCINRTGSLQEGSGCSLVQKIPLRLYLGVSTSKGDSGCDWGDIFMIDHVTKSFEKRTIADLLPYADQLMSFINTHYLDCFPSSRIKLSLLCESHDGIGLSWHTTFVTLISSLLIYLRQPEGFDSGSWDKPLREMMTGSGDCIHNIVDISLSLHECIALKPCLTTIVTLLTLGSAPYAGIGDTSMGIDQVCRVHEIVDGGHESIGLPFDMSIVYTGKPILYTPNDMREKPWKYSRFDDFEYTISQYITPQQQHTLGSQSFGGLLSATNASILYKFYTLLVGGYSDERYYSCIQSINTLKYLHDIIRGPSRQLDEIGHIMAGYFTHHNDLWCINYHDLLESGGSLMMISPRGSHKLLLPQIIDHITSHYPGMVFLYSYDQDGGEKNGLLIEQDILHHRFSRHVSGHAYTLIQNDGSMTIGEVQSLRSSHDCGVIFDLSSSRIYVGGEKLTSQDLPSQSTTIELFQKYLENGFGDVHSNQLSRSSYSRQKSEMSSKILIPLKKVIKSKLSVDFDIQLEGGSSSYTVHVDPTPQLKLGFIKHAG